MKRTPLRRKTPMERKPLPRKAPSKSVSGPLRPSKPRGKGLAQGRRRRPLEPGEATWRRKRYGVCVACGQYGRVIWHHLLTEQVVRREGTTEQLAAGAAFDRRNALPLGAPLPLGGRCTCHADHHSAKRRLSMALVSADAWSFAVEILGPARASDWYKRYYNDPKEGEQ